MLSLDQPPGKLEIIIGIRQGSGVRINDAMGTFDLSTHCSNIIYICTAKKRKGNFQNVSNAEEDISFNITYYIWERKESAGIT